MELLSEVPEHKRKELMTYSKSQRKQVVEQWRQGLVEDVAPYKKNWIMPAEPDIGLSMVSNEQ